MKLLNGDCLEELKKLPDNSVDSVVCDPPYELGFMGKSWDKQGISFKPDVWRECLRVLKPGGHLLAFTGSRTYHRIACAIEDAGFEIRDQIAWVYGCLSGDSEVLTKEGFKHFHKITQDDVIRVYDTQNDIYKWEKPQRWSQYSVEQDTAYRIKSDTTDQIVSRNHNCLVEREGKLVFVKAEDLLQMERMPVLSGDISILQEGQGELLHPELLWQSEELAKTILSERIGQKATRNWIEGREEPSVERGSDLQKEEGQVCQSENKICEMSTGVSNDVEKGRICNGTQTESCTGDKKTPNENGVCAPYQSRCNGQQDRELDAVQDERGTQEIRTRTTYKTTLATVEKIEYSGIIFCPTVSTGAFVARRNGQVFITGNSGFPKSLNVGKAIDSENKYGQSNSKSLKQIEQDGDGNPYELKGRNNGILGKSKVFQRKEFKANNKWEGWGTALKPAIEPIVMARKPISEKTVAKNVLKWGTGAINIDACRIPAINKGTPHPNSRFPANLIHDGSQEVLNLFPQSKSGKPRSDRGTGGIFSPGNGIPVGPQYGDDGSAARFFYCAKVSAKERNFGLDGFEPKFAPTMGNGIGAKQHDPETSTKKLNHHPTVKPITLMRYLVRMVTPTGGICLDPFMGSGTTGIAAKLERFRFIGIEKEPDYIKIAEQRIKNYE